MAGKHASIPQWVVDEVNRRCGVSKAPIPWTASSYGVSNIFTALCDLIMETQKAPVDPDLLVARKIAACLCEKLPGHQQYIKLDILSGMRDGCSEMQEVIAMLKKYRNDQRAS